MARQKNDGKDHKVTARLQQGKRAKNELKRAFLLAGKQEIKGNNEFLDLLKQLDADEDVSG